MRMPQTLALALLLSSAAVCQAKDAQPSQLAPTTQRAPTAPSHTQPATKRGFVVRVADATPAPFGWDFLTWVSEYRSPSFDLELLGDLQDRIELPVLEGSPPLGWDTFYGRGAILIDDRNGLAATA
jgi:hypothetical protein